MNLKFAHVKQQCMSNASWPCLLHLEPTPQSNCYVLLTNSCTKQHENNDIHSTSNVENVNLIFTNEFLQIKRPNYIVGSSRENSAKQQWWRRRKSEKGTSQISQSALTGMDKTYTPLNQQRKNPEKWELRRGDLLVLRRYYGKRNFAWFTNPKV